MWGFQFRGNKADKCLAGGVFCADYRFCRLCGCMVHYWKGRHSWQFVAGIAAVYAAWRSDWRLYYLYCYFEYQCDWAGEVGDVYCIGTDARILSH